MKKPPRRPGEPGPEDLPKHAPRAGISRRRAPIAADRAIERHLRAVSRRPGESKILSRLPDAVVSFDRDWRYVFMNRQAELNHRTSASEFLGKVVWELFPGGKQLESYRRYLTAMERQEETVYEEYVPILGRWFEQRLFPNPDGLTVIARDITDWREVRLERIKLANALAEIQARAGNASETPAEPAPARQSAANPLRTFATLFPRPGTRDALVAQIRASESFAAAVRDTSALSVELQTSGDPGGPVVVTALWSSAADYERWEQHPERITILAELDEYIEEMCVERYEVVRRATQTDAT